jgi:hypothetical protein
VVARLAFLPQSVMIEGESAGNALGRAFRLGKGNWYRVGAIMVFTYFIAASLQWAMAVPVIIGLYFYGALSAEFFVSPVWTILFTSFRDVANLLSFPISIVSFTLLYFDSRVRKEAYDVELLAREVNPGFYWQPAVRASAFGYPMPVGSSGREYVQTSPLGLAGYRPTRAPSLLEQEAPRTEAELLREKFERAAESVSARERDSGLAEIAGPQSTPQTRVCTACGAGLVTGARFCMRCGATVEGSARS